MRIVFNGTFWNQPNTGSGQYLHALHHALRELDASNEYALIEPTAIAGRSSLVENLNKVWFEQIAFPRACRARRADLAHVPYFGSAFFPRARTIVTIHDLIPMVLPLYRGSPLVRAYTQLAALSAHRADAIIADSENSKRDILRLLRVPAERVHVVYLACDARFQPVADTRAVQQKYNLPAQFVLYLGGYDQRKNLGVVIRAFAQLPEFYRAGYRLVLGGVKLGTDSAFFPDPRRLAREANLPDEAIRYLGWVDEADAPALYSSARAFVFPSLYEGFGLPPLEAMACGTPVLVANASSLPEVVGDAGLLLDPHDARAWAEALRAILTDNARQAQMRERGRAQAQKFSWRRAASETLAVYKKIGAR